MSRMRKRSREKNVKMVTNVAGKSEIDTEQKLLCGRQSEGV